MDDFSQKFSKHDCKNSSVNQDECIKIVKQNCVETYEDRLNNTDFYKGEKCFPFFDGIFCWPPIPSNTVYEIPCPNYIVGFNIPSTNATRRCLDNGNWERKMIDGDNNTWTDYSQCYNNKETTYLRFDIDKVDTINATLIEVYLPIIKHISRTGYFVSFITLVIAFCIMFFFKKLHCARNKLHMHLFASFIFRAAMSFIKDILFVDGVGMISDIRINDGDTYFIVPKNGTINWQCKTVVSIWQYFITANYSWILMEGVYLHNLILLALFSDSSNSIRYYIIFGWGLPAIVVGSYIVARIYLDDTLCWTTHGHNPYTFLIIRIPTALSILINFTIFINIARVLLLKMRSPISEETKLYRRWARSTLVLVPLFGVHYALFLGMSYSIGLNETIEIIWLFCDQLFASFQGFFVAVLYCFLNGEVKTELRPHINNFVALWQSKPLSFFNCGQFSRSTAGRPSVCTTLSCSSLYTSSVNHKYPGRKSKWDITQTNGIKPRHSSIPENYHVCHLNEKTCPDHSNLILQYDSTAALRCPDNCSYSSKATQLTEITENTACLGHCDHNTKPDSSIDLEMITIANK